MENDIHYYIKNVLGLYKSPLFELELKHAPKFIIDKLWEYSVLLVNKNGISAAKSLGKLASVLENNKVPVTTDGILLHGTFNDEVFNAIHGVIQELFYNVDDQTKDDFMRWYGIEAIIPNEYGNTNISVVGYNLDSYLNCYRYLDLLVSVKCYDFDILEVIYSIAMWYIILLFNRAIANEL